MFETTGSVGIAKKKLITLIRLISASKREHPNISSYRTSHDPVGFHSEFVEAEAKKAQALLYWDMSRRLKVQ
jgi:hypothetical protein